MTSEEDVFNAVMQWISCDVQQRKQYLSKVIIHSKQKDSIRIVFRY